MAYTYRGAGSLDAIDSKKKAYAAGGGGFVDNSGSGKTPGAPTQPGGFVNLGTYLDLNKAAGKEMAGQLAGAATAPLKQAAQGLYSNAVSTAPVRQTPGNPGADRFGGNVGSLLSSAAPAAAPAPPSAEAQYAQAQKTAGDISAASQNAKALAGGFDSRQSFVNEKFGQGAAGYSAGMGLYDNALASANAGKQFAQAGSLADYLGTQASGAILDASDARAIAARQAAPAPTNKKKPVAKIDSTYL